MKTKSIIFTCLLSMVIILTASYQCAGAKSKKQKDTTKIAVVNLRSIFQDCKKSQEFKNQLTAEQQKAEGQMDKLVKEIEAIQADINTRKIGSSDYMDLTRQVMEKKAALEARQEYLQRELAFKEQVWTEALYTKILETIGEVAKEKELEMVFEKDQIELPAPNPTELMLAIRTHKLLYSAESLDITPEVLAAVDAAK